MAGYAHYRAKYGAKPNFLNVPTGFLTDEEVEQLKQRWTVAINAPSYFKHEIWLGVMTPAEQQLEA